MRKDCAVPLRDYCSSPNQSVPERVTFGLAWDITDGKNVDLGASAICLNASFEVVDIVSDSKLTSDDYAIIHSGDERDCDENEGDKLRDNEQIHLYLQRMNPSIKYVGFVINSHNGQELDDINKASCHLFNSTTKEQITQYNVINNCSLDKQMGLIMSVLYLDDTTGSWCMRTVSESGNDKVAQNFVGQLQRFLKNNPPPAVQEVHKPEIISNTMPKEVQIPVVPIVPTHEIINNIFIP